MADATVGWFPVVTLVVGYLTKSVSDWLQHRRTLERDRETREADRQDKLFEHRAAFQRQTLLDLQETLMQLFRTTGVMHQHDLMEFRTTGEWQKSLFPQDLDESNRVAVARTSMLAVRVQDQKTRELVKNFKNATAAVTESAAADESTAAMARIGPVFEELNHRIGDILRKLDEEL